MLKRDCHVTAEAIRSEWGVLFVQLEDTVLLKCMYLYRLREVESLFPLSALFTLIRPNAASAILQPSSSVLWLEKRRKVLFFKPKQDIPFMRVPAKDPALWVFWIGVKAGHTLDKSLDYHRARMTSSYFHLHSHLWPVESFQRNCKFWDCEMKPGNRQRTDTGRTCKLDSTQ